MANDLSNPVQAHQASGDGFFENGAEADSLFGTVQLAQANAAAPKPGQTIHVAAPQGAQESAPVVIRVEVAPGSTVELPQPFEADAALLAKEGDGNLAIRVGDVTVILQGYVDANQQTPVIIEGADNQPIDIATILASTDPAIDIQTAAGAGDAAQGGQGADNTGAILSQLADGDGLSGFNAVGSQDQTELGYRTIDASIRNDFADTLVTADVFGFSVGTISTSFGEGRLRDPAQVGDLGDFENFMQQYHDAVVHDEPMYAGWADFNGNAITGGASDFEDYIAQTSQITTVDANFTGATGDLVLTDIGNTVYSNHSELKATLADQGHTMFLRRESDGALVAVVHVEQDGNGHFVIQTFLINRIDHDGAGKDSMDIEVLFKLYDGPAPQQPNPEQQEGGEGTEVPEGPTSPSLDGSFNASFADDVPILENISYHNQHDTKPTEARIAGDSDHGLIDEDWIRGGAHDLGPSPDGDTGGGNCVTGCIEVSFGADGAAKSDAKGEDAGKHGFELNTGLKLGDFYAGLESGGEKLQVLSISGDHITVGIPFGQQQTLTEGTEGDEKPVTDPIPGCTIFTLTLDQDTGHFKFELKGPLDHQQPGDEIFGGESGLTALVAAPVEETIPLAFGVKAIDDDGDSIDAMINIDVNDDVPVARDDSDTVAEGSHDEISGNVITAAGEDSNAGKDSQGGDHAHVTGVAAGEHSDAQSGKVGTVIQGEHGTLILNADGSYKYNRDAYSEGGVEDKFTYTLTDGDGDTSTATLTIHITNSEVTIDLPACDAETTVYEAGLPEGSNAGADSEQTDGTITIHAKDGIKSLEIGGDTLTLEDLKDLSPSDPHKITDSTGELSLTGFNESTGELSYTYVLKDTHDSSGSSVSFDIKVTDVDDDAGTATLQIDIVDDDPTANCDTISLNAPKEATADVQFILDISGSMEDRDVNVSGYPDNGVGLERYAVQQMLDAHPEIQNVQFVLFDEHAFHSDWMTRQEALDWLKDGDNFKNGGGNTNFDAALNEAMEGLVEDRPLAHGDQTLVYFFSDGEPNQPHSDPGITDYDNGFEVSKAEWQNFVDTHDVSNVFAVGIGTLDPNEISELNPIAYPEASDGTEQNRLNITDTNSLGGLLETLNDTIIPVVTPITGDVTLNDVPGADGFGDGKLVSVDYEGTAYAFDSTTHEHAIDLGAGRGTLVIKDDGTYEYTPPSKNADGMPFYVEYTIQDGDGDTSTAKLKIDINTRPETDLNGGDQGADNTAHFVEDCDPINIAPHGTVSSDDNLVAMTVTLTDRPDGNSAESLGLSQAAKDAATAANISWSYDASTGKLTFTGSASPAVYQTLLQGIQYNNTSQNPDETDRHITVVVNDGTFSSVSHEIDLCVTAMNDAPDADIAPATFNAKEGEELTLSVPGVMSVSDVDAGSEDITVTLKVSEGELNVSKGNSGVHSISGDDTNTVTIVGTLAEINKLLSGNSSGYIKYINDNDSPSSAVELKLTVNDKGEYGIGGAMSDSDTATINVENVNDKPGTDLNGASYGSDNWVSFTEDQGPIQIAPAGKVIDDQNKISSMTVILTDHPDNGAESLGLNQAAKDAVSANGLSWSYDAATYKLTISGPTAPVSAYETILRGVTYNNTSQSPDESDRDVTVVVNDGQYNSTTHTVEISVTEVNDAPLATISLNSYNATEDQALTLSGTGLSISDVDSGSGTMTVTLSVGEGDLDVTKGSTGVTVNDFGGTVVLSGSVAQINNLLAGNNGGIVKYLNTNNTPSPTTTLTLKVDDNGHDGGGNKSSTDTATINVANANEKPETDLNGTGGGKSGQDNSASFTEDAGAIKIAPSGIVTDDSGKIGSMTVTLTNHPEGSAETLDLNTAAKNVVTSNGLSWNYDSATYKLTVSGPLVSQSVYQTILQGVLYNNASQAPTETTRSVTVVVNDGTDNSDSHTVTISVDAVNDAPVATITPLTFNAVEDQELVLSGAGLAISDVDASNGVVTVTLSVGEGKLTVSGGNSGIDSVSGNNSGAVTVTGTLAEINNLLAGTSTGSVKYLNTNDTPSASTTLTLKVNDEGFTGGGDLISTDTATIFVANAPEAKDDSVYTNAGANAFNIPEWALLYNDAGQDVSKLDLAAAATALSNVTGGTANHVDGAGTLGYVTFSDNNGSSSSGFDYKMGDGTLSDTGHVSVIQDSGNIDASNNDDIVVVYGGNNTQVDAGDGNDIVLGGSGHNTLNGQDGNDVMLGGAGNDTMNGGNDHDQLYGEDGNDTLNGDDNNDTLYGGAGNDTLNGGNHDDALNGGDNDDSLNGGSGNDTLHGDAGNDKLDGGSGSDLIFGDAGHDTMIYGSGDTFNGGSDFDRVQINGAAGVTINYNESKFIGVEMIDLGAADAYDRNGSGNQNTLALNAADITYHGSANKIGSHEISLFVVGDIDGNGGMNQQNNRDNVDLDQSNWTKISGASGPFTDPTGDTHTFDIYQSKVDSTVKIAIEQGIDVV